MNASGKKEYGGWGASSVSAPLPSIIYDRVLARVKEPTNTASFLFVQTTTKMADTVWPFMPERKSGKKRMERSESF
jgi:hypothetical protein